MTLSLEQKVPAGNVLAIGGLDTAILKSATLSSSPAARPLAPMLFQVRLVLKNGTVQRGLARHGLSRILS